MSEPADVGRLPQPPHVVEVEAGRREQVLSVVVLELEDPTDEREPVRMHACGRQADDRVADFDARAVDQPLALDDPDTRAGEVELVVLVDPGKLCRLPADERDAGVAADLRRALDELCDLLEVDPVRGDVVEEEERIGAARQDVVDAVRGEVGAAVAKRAARAREDQLGADGVRGGGQQAVSSSGCSPANAPKPVAPVDSTAARRRSTMASPVANETPALA